MPARYLLLAAAALGLASAASAQTGEPPLPDTLSPQMRAALAQPTAPPPGPIPLPQMRAFIDLVQQKVGAEQRKTYAVDLADSEIGGVPVRVITPAHVADPKAVLLNLHGGGFQVDSGSLTENIPIASLTGLKVVAVRYRLAPEYPYPVAVDDALAVYRALLKDYAPSRIAVYGTSAGAVLAPELIARLKAEKLPLPAAVGFFSGTADFARLGDSAKRFAPPPPLDVDAMTRGYLGDHATTDPAASPVYGELRDFPPTYCITSTRDFLLSATADFCRALDRAGVSTKMTVFDGPPHAFWSYILAPESDEAFRDMAAFFKARLLSRAPARDVR